MTVTHLIRVRVPTTTPSRADVAQLIAQLFRKQKVAGLSPAIGSRFRATIVYEVEHALGKGGNRIQTPIVAPEIGLNQLV